MTTRVPYSMTTAPVNVRAFGAKGNGTTDDTAAIQAALTAAFNAGGGEVHVPAGTYRITAPLIVRSNTTFSGEGPCSIIKRTGTRTTALTSVIAYGAIYVGYSYEWGPNGENFNPAYDDDATMAQLLARDFSKITTKNVTIRDLYIHTETNGLGVYVVNSRDVLVENIWAYDNKTPVSVGNDAVGNEAACLNVTVRNIFQVYSGIDSWYDVLFVGAAMNVTASGLHNNPATPSALNGMVVFSGTRVFSLTGSTLTGDYGALYASKYGVLISGSASAGTVSGNTIRQLVAGVQLGGAGVAAADRCAVVGNTFDACYVDIAVQASGAAGGGHLIHPNLSSSNGFAQLSCAGAGPNLTDVREYGHTVSRFVGTLGTTLAERNTADGRTLFNQAAAIGAERVGITFDASSAIDHGLLLNDIDATNTGRFSQKFRRNGTVVGSVQTSLTATTYVTSSDYRLKDITGPLTGSRAFIDALAPKQGTWKTNGAPFAGFLAHELQAVSPSSVAGEKDAVDDSGAPVYQGVQAGSAEVIAHIVARLQELQAELDALRAS